VRVALIVNKVTGRLKTDLSYMEELGRKAAQSRVDLILYPEAAPTGLINNDDPGHDLPLGTPIPGPITERLAKLARQAKAYLASGILERDGNCLYDSAIILDPVGKIVLHYRRIQPQWHGRKADPHVYRQGEEVVAALTPLGKLTVLICGDLFDDQIIARLRRLGPDYLLFPFSVDFDDGSFDQRRWDQEEQPAYAARAAVAGCTTLMTNLLVDVAVADCPSYGGAMVVSPQGEVLARKPLGQPGVLIADV
jgi:N-carbamoylputrescine amidase